MAEINVFLLLCTLFCHARTLQYVTFQNDTPPGTGPIHCTLSFFPSKDRVNDSWNSFEQESISCNSDICSSKPFQITRIPNVAEVIEAEVSCAQTTTVKFEAEFTDKVAIRFFQIRCEAKFRLGLVEEGKEDKGTYIWTGPDSYGVIQEVWTAQLIDVPLKWGDRSTDHYRQWSLSKIYTAHAISDKNVNISISLNLGSYSIPKEGILPVHPDFTFYCEIRIHYGRKHNEIPTGNHDEKFVVEYGNQNCEDFGIPVRYGKMEKRVNCMGPAKLAMLVNFSVEMTISYIQLECSAPFPIDLRLSKPLPYAADTSIEANLDKPNVRYRAKIRANPYYVFNSTTEYLFYSLSDPSLNIFISLEFSYPKKKENNCQLNGPPEPELKIYSFDVRSFECSYPGTDDSLLRVTYTRARNPSETRASSLQDETCPNEEETLNHSHYATYRSEHGLVFCRYRGKYSFLEYFTPLTSNAVRVNFSSIWEDENVIHIQQDDETDTLNVPMANNLSNIDVFYESEDAGFECLILKYFLQVPIFWWIIYSNGSTEYLPPQYDVKPEKKKTQHYINFYGFDEVPSSHVNIRLAFGMTAVGCGAAYWNFARNATVIYPVEIKGLLEATSPAFFAEESYHSVNLGTVLNLSCSADVGKPDPSYLWSFFGKDFHKGLIKNKAESDSSFYTVSTTIQNGTTTSNLIIEAFRGSMEGEYVCVAANVRGNSSYRFKVELTSETSSRATWIFLSVFVGLLALFGASLFAATRKFYFRRGQLSALEINVFEKGDDKELQFGKSAQEKLEFVPYNTGYEMDWNDFKIFNNQKLGEGEYGVVYKGCMTANTTRTIAIKTLKEGADKPALLSMLSELKLMIYLESDENIVKLIGACTSFLKQGRVYLLIEYCPMGSLELYLRKIDKKTFRIDGTHPGYDGIDETPEWNYDNLGRLTIKDLIGWGVQIARGMQHLESKQVIHGDLAARNVLLYSKSQVKISDFGLSRQLLNYDNYTKKSQEGLPWRWLALETLKSFKFTHKSDVWGYGVTIWEIFTLGLVPYPGMCWTAEFVSLLEENLRLHQPQFASEDLYNIMYRCWDSDPESRPDFQELEELLLNLGH